MNSKLNSAPAMLNGLNTTAFLYAAAAITEDFTKGETKWHVTSHWRGGTRSDTSVKSYVIGGQEIPRDFTIRVDEPIELCGTNQYANPQEYLLAALNACMIVCYTINCALEGIELEELRIETEGGIDLRGLLTIDPSVPPGYEELCYTVHITGNGTPEQFENIHRAVMATSPNYFNLSNAIRMRPRLVIGTSQLQNAA
jgi:hypothetical protein